MKTFQLIPAFRNVDELQKIVNLIRECIEPVKVILLGRYAGMELASALGGYELLVITRSRSKMGALGVQQYIDKRFLPKERTEKRLSIYLLPFDFVVGKHHSNYFLYTVSVQGYILYDDDAYSLWRRSGFKSAKALRAAQQDMDRCLGLGFQFLQDAESRNAANQCRMTAFLIYQTARQFLLAVALVVYGFEPHEENSLISDYSLARHASEELSGLWDLDDLQSRDVLNRLHSFNHASRFAHNFNYPPQKLAEYLDQLRCLALEAEKVCRARLNAIAVITELQV